MIDATKAYDEETAQSISGLTHVLKRCFANVDVGEQVKCNIVDSLNKVADALSDIAKALDKR